MDVMRKLIGILQLGLNVFFVELGFVEKLEDIWKCEEIFLVYLNVDMLIL